MIGRSFQSAASVVRMASLAQLLCRLGLLMLFSVGSEAIYAKINQNEPPAYCTLFNHMVKSGGSTIRDKLITASLEDGLEGEPAMCVNGWGDPHMCIDALNATVITGYSELIRAPLKEIGRECDYFTMVRHPIDRLVSAFFYCPKDHDVQNRPVEWCGDSDHPKPVMERLVRYAQFGWKNEAFREMAFGHFCPRKAFCEEAKPKAPRTIIEPGGWDLLLEVQVILETYVAVGIMEHWDLSMQLFDARVKSPVKNWQDSMRSNPGRQSAFRQEVFEWAHKSPVIHMLMSTDMLLYDYAYSVFKLQTAASLGTVWA